MALSFIENSCILLGTTISGGLSLIYLFPKLLEVFNCDLNTNKNTKFYQISRKVANLLFKLRYIIFPKHLSREYGGEISDIIVYPIKSFGGFKVARWKIDEYGLIYDRKFALAQWKEDEKEYKILTSRDCNKLAMVHTAFMFNQHEGKDPYDDGSIVVSYPLKGSLKCTNSFKIPVNIKPEVVEGSRTKPLDMWGVKFKVYNLGSLLLPEDFIKQLDLPEDTALLYSDTGKFCKTKSPNPAAFVDTTSFRSTLFQDYYPALICQQSDIDFINKKLIDHKFSVRSTATRFRVNIVIGDNNKIHDTDSWDKFIFKSKGSNEEYLWSITQKCARCTVPNIGPEEGKMDPQSSVTKTMAKYRRVDPLAPFKTFFGTYGIQHSSGYEIKRGDKIEVLQRAFNSFELPA